MKQFASLIGLLGFCFSSVHSQCSFTPTVTPNNLVMCPYDTAFLTTETYDSYQWYKDGSPISGETNQTLMVVAGLDAGSQFYVECTLAACTENSDTVLVDGWVFLLPYVITNTPPVEIDAGNSYYCNGTVVELELGLPYTENITWYDDGTPLAGEDSSILHVTEDGYYYVSGAPAVCPDFEQTLGVTIPIFFYPPFEPEFSDLHSPVWEWWDWDCTNCETCIFYHIDTTSYGGAPIDTGVVFDPGTPNTLDNLFFQMEYRAECYDSSGCLGIDTVMFIFENVEENPMLHLNLFPNPVIDVLQLTIQDDMENYQVRFMDIYGRIVKQQKLNSTMDVSDLSSGIYVVEVFSKKYYLRKRMVKS